MGAELMPTTSKKYEPCPHCKKREVLGLDGGGRALCLCGENYYPTKAVAEELSDEG